MPAAKLAEYDSERVMHAEDTDHSESEEEPELETEPAAGVAGRKLAHYTLSR